MPATRRPSPRRWNALPALVRDAPPRVLLVVGGVVVVLGALIVSRPLTSIVLLGLYVGASAVVMGVLELVGRPAGWWARAVSAAWIVAGVAVLVWLGRSLELLPPVLAVLLVAGWIGLTVAGSILHLVSVVVRVRDFSRPVPAPNPVRDGVLVGVAVGGVALLALALATSIDPLRWPATALLLLAALALATIALRSVILAFRLGPGGHLG